MGRSVQFLPSSVTTTQQAAAVVAFMQALSLSYTASATAAHEEAGSLLDAMGAIAWTR